MASSFLRNPGKFGWFVFSESRTSVLLELALTTTLAAFLLFLAAAPYFGKIAAFFISVLLVCLPIIQVYSAEEMAESLLLVTTFEAAVFFAKYLESKRWQDSLWFALFCSLAILTKGNGWALAAVPPLAILLTRNWSILKRPSFWLAVPVVALLCLPWQLLTMDLAQRGWTGGSKPSLQYTLSALGQFGVIAKDLVGWPVLLLASVGVWSRLRSGMQPFFAVMLSLAVSIWIFHSVVPAGVEGRKMINAIPPILLFALPGGELLARRVSEYLGPFRMPFRWSCAVMAALVAACFATTTFAIPQEEHYGYTELSSYIETRPELSNSVILVSSERDGEGLLVSELAMQDRRPSHTVLRANKTLSNSDWTGEVSQQFCATPDDVMTFLKRERVSAVVVDTFPRRTHYQHNDLILQAIRDYPASWRLRATFGDGKIRIYDFAS